MRGLSKERALQSLRARIEDIEKHPALRDFAGPTAAGNLFAVPQGVLHEVFVDAGRESGAGFGFSLGLTRPLLGPRRPALLLLQLAHKAQDLGVPYPAGLLGLGIEPHQIVYGQMDSATDLLWAIEEAVGCPAVAAVIADTGAETQAFDFTASRRLSLRSAAGGSSVFLLRTGSGREASAARFRWRITPQPSVAPPFDARAPGLPSWKIELEKGRLGSRRDPREWLVDWTENGFAVVAPKRAMGASPAAAARTPLSGALSAALGDRLSQTG